MKIFVIDYRAIWSGKGFLEAKTQADAIKWFVENMPPKSRILKINEGNSSELSDLKTIFKKHD